MLTGAPWMNGHHAKVVVNFSKSVLVLMVKVKIIDVVLSASR